MKKFFTYKNIVSALSILIFAVAFLFLAIAYEGHFLFWEGNNYWEYSWAYFLQSLQPAALATYVSNFLQLFYRWHYVGCMVFLLPSLIVYFSLRTLFEKIQVAEEYLSLALLPVVALLQFLMDKLCFLSIGFWVAFFYLFLAVYVVLIKGRDIRRSFLVLFLIYPFLFFFLPSGVVLVFALTLFVLDTLLFSQEKKSRLVVKNLVFFLFALLVPMLWSFMVNHKLSDDVYSLNITLFANQNRWKVLFLFFLPILFFVWFNFLKKGKIKIKKWFSFCLVLIAVCAVGVAFSVYKKEKGWERFFRIESACFNNNWDKIVQLSESQKATTDDLFPYTVVAHAAKGDLPFKMFEYPLTAKGVFSPESNLKNINIQANVACYEACGMLNAALVYAFQNTSIRANEHDILTLKQLARLNALLGDKNISEKYLNKLKKTLFYNDFVEEWNAFEFVGSGIATSDSALFFTSGDKHIELIALLDRQYNPVAADLLLCSLLKMRDCDNFVKYFFKYYPYRECDVLPKAYEEFLVMAPKANIELPNTDFKISEATRKRFEQFLSIYTSNSDGRIKRLQLKSFSDTWFYYAVYGK